MQYTPSGTHDGFDIIQSHPLVSRGVAASGHLPAGRYFAVALYYGARGHWFCPPWVNDVKTSQSGVVSSVCFGERSPACSARLTVKEDRSTAAPGK